METIQNTGFKVNPEKAQLVKQTVSYLGVTLGQEGKSRNKNRVELITKLPIPRDVSALRSFLGLTGFSREFNENYVGIARPLYRLLKKGTSWQWGKEEQKAFNDLKKALADAPVLAYPKQGLPFYLHLATTLASIGAVLLQNQAGQLRPVAYSSKTLSEVEERFSACEREAFALVWSLKH